MLLLIIATLSHFADLEGANSCRKFSRKKKKKKKKRITVAGKKEGESELRKRIKGTLLFNSFPMQGSEEITSAKTASFSVLDKQIPSFPQYTPLPLNSYC